MLMCFRIENMVNYFNEYFVNIGRTLASKLDNVEPDSHQKYLKNPASNLFSLQLATEDTISKFVDTIPAKDSTGVDDLSTFKIKYVKPELLKAVNTTINQSLTTGICPNNLKLAKVFPLFKKGDPTSVSNYRLISHILVLSEFPYKVSNIPSVPKPVIKSKTKVFQSTTEEEIINLILVSSSKLCDLDRISTNVLKKCPDILIPPITDIMNISRETCTFPQNLKEAWTEKLQVWIKLVFHFQNLRKR